MSLDAARTSAYATKTGSGSILHTRLHFRRTTLARARLTRRRAYLPIIPRPLQRQKPERESAHRVCRGTPRRMSEPQASLLVILGQGGRRQPEQAKPDVRGTPRISPMCPQRRRARRMAST